jgi:CRISPR/Cas system-associated exonuclease Cas4 (RecB family)
MDYVTAQYPPKFIRGLFDLTEAQINAALAYIKANRADVEAEYQMVLKEAEELRLYYEEKNRDLIARIAAQPPRHGTEAAWEKLRAAKAKREAKA